MSSNRILYISYDPGALVQDEQWLMQAGYEVDSVFGTDGLMVRGSAADYGSIFIGHGCPVEDRRKILSWLKLTSPEVKIFPADWAQEQVVCDRPARSSAVSAPSEKAAPGFSRDSLQEERSQASSGVHVYEYSGSGSPAEIAVEFRLLYWGELPSMGRSGRQRKQQAHTIRKQFHQQLRLLWQQHRALSGFLTAPQSFRQEPSRSMAEKQADNFARCGYRFVPLVSRETGLECSLEMLLLRRDGPAGRVPIADGSDLRLSLLLDALRMPRTSDEVESVPGMDEDPFYVLMEDDSLVNRMAIDTDRLLTPPTSQDSLQDVMLLIHVKATLTQQEWAHSLPLD